MREMIGSTNASKLRPLAMVRCGWISQVRWSPSGNTLAVAAGEGVRLFVNSFGGTPTYILNGHTAHVKGIAFNADGTLLASVAADMTIKLWDLAAQVEGQDAVGIREIKCFRGHTGAVEAIAFSPDGRTLVTGGGDATVRLWDIETGEIKAVFEGHTAEVTSVAFALDGNLIISGSWDNSLRLWDTANETGGTVLGEHDDWVREVVVNPTSTMLASASKDSSSRLWDAYAEDSYALIKSHWQGADCVGFSPDGKLLATGGRDDTVRLWDLDQVLRDRECDKLSAIATLTDHTKAVISLAFNTAGTLLATASGDNTVRLWGVH